jgi:hypothetical protein
MERDFLEPDDSTPPVPETGAFAPAPDARLIPGRRRAFHRAGRFIEIRPSRDASGGSH